MADLSKTLRELKKYNIKKSILTIGSFDGVHLGHKKILDKVNFISSEKSDAKKIVITFDPNPYFVLNKNKINKNYLINSLNNKISILKSYYNIDNVIILKFDNILSQTSAEKFLKVIVKAFNPCDIVVGYNNKFGYKKEGDINFLIKKSEIYKFNVHEIKAKKTKNITEVTLPRDTIISSTLIRTLLIDNRLIDANALLGRTFSLFGTIIKGNGIGKKINFPTINIKIFDKRLIRPNRGVYFVKVSIDDVDYKGMCNIGFRPTITNSKEESIEVHIFSVGISSNFYNKDVSVFFIKFIRDEKKFKNLEFLAKQLEKDKQNCLSINF